MLGHYKTSCARAHARSAICFCVCDAFAEGKTVTEWSDKSARNEMKALGRELEQLLQVKFMGNE